MPMFMAPVIVGLLGRFLTDSTYGLYAWVLRETHIYTGDILGSPTSAFIAVTLMDVWEWTPLIALIVLAGPVVVPKPVLEAARVDGATYWQRLRHIVFPMISGVVIVALLVRSMDAIRYFDIIYNTTNGGPGGRDEDRPDPALRDGLPLLRPRLRGGDRPLDAGGLDPGREPVHAHAQEAGAGEMKGGRIGSKVLLGVVLLWTLVPLLWMLLSSLKPRRTSPRRRRRSPSRRRSTTTGRCSAAATTSAPTSSTRSSPPASRRSSPSGSARSPATASRAASSAARTTSRSGSSRRGWRRSPPPCCRCS